MKSNFQFSIFNFQLIMDKENIPEHVAIIMDGNGRWAKSLGLERWEGHKKGVDAVRTAMEAVVAIRSGRNGYSPKKNSLRR